MRSIPSIAALLACVMLSAVPVFGQPVTVVWDRSPETDVDGYIVSYGTQPRGLQPYPDSVQVTTNQWAFTPPSSTTPYYFSVRAKNTGGLISDYSSEVMLEPRGVVPAPPGSWDVNGDGRIDLLWQHDVSGTLSAWLMNGTSLQSGRPLSPAQVSDRNWKIVGTGDFNRDGQVDLFWQHQVTRLMTIWFMNGTVFTGPGLLSNNTVSDTNWEIRAIGDITGDGWPDLIWQHRTQGSLVAWILEGTRLVEGRPLTPGRISDPNWKIMGLGDFSGDNRPDLVWQNQVNGTVSVWVMNGTNFVEGRGVYPNSVVSDTDWKIVNIVDLNNDSRPDLLWQHRTLGWLSAWLMNGTALMRATLLNPSQVGDLAWRIVGPR